jgi:hypothetical protein
MFQYCKKSYKGFHYTGTWFNQQEAVITWLKQEPKGSLHLHLHGTCWPSLLTIIARGSASVSVILLEFELTKTCHFIQRSKFVVQIGKKLINA